MDNMTSAISAVLAEDQVALISLLDSQPALVRQTVVEEEFIATIVHQIYAGDTLLHLAAAALSADMAALLIARGADVTARNRRGAQALHYACDGNRQLTAAQIATIKVLLKAGADPNARDKSGTAPLHRAVRTRSPAAVKTLLEGGANVHQKNGSGSSALFLAQRTTGASGSGTPESKAKQLEIIHLLQAAGAVM